MIILQIKGGLGNQLFQYSFLKRLKHFYKDDDLVIDLSLSNQLKGKGGGNHEGFLLKRFQIDPAIRCVDSLKEANIKLGFFQKFYLKVGYYVLARKKLRFMRGLTSLWTGFFGGIILDEGGYAYRKPPRTWCRKKYVSGYFQDERAFRDFRSELLKDLSFKEEMEQKNVAVRDMMEATNSVCMHFRFGDYLLPGNKGIFDVLSDTYYEDAVRHVQEKVENPKFFVFSDDVNMAQEKYRALFKTLDVEFMTEKNTSIQELMLMSSCKHFVIPTVHSVGGRSTFQKTRSELLSRLRFG